jgi:hypothetical protein
MEKRKYLIFFVFITILGLFMLNLFSLTDAVSLPFECVNLPTNQTCSGSLVGVWDCEGVGDISSSDNKIDFLTANNLSNASMVIEFINDSIPLGYSFNGSVSLFLEIDSTTSFCEIKVWNGSWVLINKTCNQTGDLIFDLNNIIVNETQFENLKINITVLGNSSNEENWALDLAYVNCSYIDDIAPSLSFENPTPCGWIL